MVLLEGQGAPDRGVDRFDQHLRGRHRTARPTSATGCATRTSPSTIEAYWDLLSHDPGRAKTATPNRRSKQERGVRDGGRGAAPRPRRSTTIAAGITPSSARAAAARVLSMYAQLVDEAKTLRCITLAFGISKEFKDAARRQHRRQPHHLPAAGEGGQAEPEGQGPRSSSSMPRTTSTRHGDRSSATRSTSGRGRPTPRSSG